MSVVDVAIWAAGVAALFALIYVHRRAVVPAAPAPVAKPAATTSPSLLADGEAAIDSLITQIEADAKAWEAHASQVTAVKAKVAAIKVPAAAAPAAPAAPVA